MRSKTLSQFIIASQKKFPEAKGNLTQLLNDLSIAAKIVSREISKAGLAGILGTSGQTNVHGEEVKKIDEFANEEFLLALRAGGACCVIASEENEDIISIAEAKDAPYAVLIDPVDGSSNSDVNITIGTIFSIYNRISPPGPGLVEDCLQPGWKQVAAGYVIYGSSTMLVYTSGDGVNGFTLDNSIGEFYLSHPNLMIPENGKFYSINEGNYQRFEEGIRSFIDYCQVELSASDTPYISRHIGSLVADFHRNLIKGGIFIYPATKEHKKGKLRLMYECNPMAFIVEQAGGRASDGYQCITQLQPENIHDHTPLIIGSKEMVNLVENFLKNQGHIPDHNITRKAV